MNGTTIIYFKHACRTVAVYLSDHGRMISVGIDGRIVHDKKRRNRNCSTKVKIISSAAAKKLRHAACGVVALVALGHRPEKLPAIEMEL